MRVLKTTCPGTCRECCHGCHQGLLGRGGTHRKDSSIVGGGTGALLLTTNMHGNTGGRIGDACQGFFAGVSGMGGMLPGLVLKQTFYECCYQGLVGSGGTHRQVLIVGGGCTIDVLLTTNMHGNTGGVGGPLPTGTGSGSQGGSMVASKQRPSGTEVILFREVFHRSLGGARCFFQHVHNNVQFIGAAWHGGRGGGEGHQQTV